MKKLLPASKNLSVNKTTNNGGFTLIELMIVVAIIGILALVGLGVFSGAQGSARDGRREVEIDSLAKNIESTRDPQTGGYQYTSAIMAGDYPNGLADPGTYVYCQKAIDTTTPPGNASAWGSGTCPSGWAAIGAAGGTTTNNKVVSPISGENNDVADGLGATSAKYTKGWTVCASLERSNTVFCKSNLIR